MSVYKKVKNYLNKYGLLSLLFKGLWKVFSVPAFILHTGRKVVFYFYTKCWVKNIFGKVHIQGIAGNVRIGKNATIYPGVILEIGEDAQVRIGDHFTLSYGALIACREFVNIGNHVMIGEYTSIRDTTHAFDSNNQEPYMYQPDKMAGIEIGGNVWVGRGCIILPGTVVEQGVIIAANSVVKGHLKAYWLYGGTPAKPIRALREPLI